MKMNKKYDFITPWTTLWNVQMSQICYEYPAFLFLFIIIPWSFITFFFTREL